MFDESVNIVKDYELVSCPSKGSKSPEAVYLASQERLHKPISFLHFGVQAGNGQETSLLVD